MKKESLFKIIKSRIYTYGKAVVIRPYFGVSTIVTVDELAHSCGPGREHLPHRITAGDGGYLVEGFEFGVRWPKPLDYKHGYAPPICPGGELYCDLEELINSEDIAKVL